MTILEVLQPDGATFEPSKQGDRTTAITWKKEIPPKAAAEFVFRARNPASGDIAWKAQLRLTTRFKRLVARGKAKPKVATAIARELTGFIWAIAREVSPARR